MTSPAKPSEGTVSPARTIASWVFVALWAGVIFWWSSKPGTQIPGRYADIGHLGEYTIFGALLYSALRSHLRRADAVALAIVLASVYGMSDEFHQHFVYLRTPDVVDWGVDTVGATIGAVLGRVTAGLATRQ